MELENVIFGLIVNSGECRSMAFEALQLAKEGNFEKAKELQKQADTKSIEAHTIQTELIQREAQGDNIQLSLLMVHAQDHLMTSILARELINEIISLHEKVDAMEKKEEKDLKVV
jgi:PTS system cellobiose-specific IIA component